MNSNQFQCRQCSTLYPNEHCLDARGICYVCHKIPGDSTEWQAIKARVKAAYEAMIDAHYEVYSALITQIERKKKRIRTLKHEFEHGVIPEIKRNKSLAFGEKIEAVQVKRAALDAQVEQLQKEIDELYVKADAIKL